MFAVLEREEDAPVAAERVGHEVGPAVPQARPDIGGQARRRRAVLVRASARLVANSSTTAMRTPAKRTAAGGDEQQSGIRPIGGHRPQFVKPRSISHDCADSAGATFVDLFEYQGKQLFARYGIPVSPGAPATTVTQAVEEADALGYPVVVKAQVQVGGRGKAGGIKLAPTPPRPAPTPRPSSAWTSRATSSRSCGSRRRATSPRSTTRRSRSTVRRSCTSACSRRRAASRSSRWRRRIPTPSRGSTSIRSTA